MKKINLFSTINYTIQDFDGFTNLRKEKKTTFVKEEHIRIFNDGNTKIIPSVKKNKF